VIERLPQVTPGAELLASVGHVEAVVETALRDADMAKLRAMD
jgi:hypothetical protein